MSLFSEQKSRHFARLLQIRQMFPISAVHTALTHPSILPLLCSGPAAPPGTAAGHCLFSRLSSVSKWLGKQTAFKAHRSCVWRKNTVAEPLEESACSVPPSAISQGRHGRGRCQGWSESGQKAILSLEREHKSSFHTTKLKVKEKMAHVPLLHLVCR